MFEKKTDHAAKPAKKRARSDAGKYVQVTTDATVDACSMRVTRVEEAEAAAEELKAREAVLAEAGGLLRLGIDVGSTTVKVAVLDATARGACTRATVVIMPTFARPSSRC